MLNFNNLRPPFQLRIPVIIITLFISISSFCEDTETNIKDYIPDIIINESNNPAPGYFFVASKKVIGTGTTKSDENDDQYLAIIDNYGTYVFFRRVKGRSSSMRLLEDGRIVFYNGIPQKLKFLNEMLNQVDFMTSIGYKTDGHDWDISEAGNILMLGKDIHTEDLSQLVEGGQTEVSVVDFVVQEFDSDKNLLYTWKSRDDFDILDAYGDFYSLANYTSAKLDHLHTNSVHFDSDTSFLISSRHLNEITKIDRRTQEILWRWGGKNNEFTFINDDLHFSHQHSISRTPDGTILFYDNGNGRDFPYSSAVEYELDEVNMTATLINRYRRNPDAYTSSGGNTQRVYNGNIVLGWNTNTPSFTEFHPDGTVAVEMDYSHHSFSNRTEKYLWETKIFETNVDSLEFGEFDGTNPIQKTIDVTNNSDAEISITSYSTHTDYFQVTTALPLAIAAQETVQIDVTYDPSLSNLGYIKDLLTLNHDIDTQRVARQVWLFGTQEDNAAPYAEITPNGGDVARDSAIVINLSEPIKILNGEELAYNTIDNYIIFRLDDINGTDVGFNASISSDKMTIKIVPNDTLLAEQYYFIVILANLSDYSGNALPVAAATFYTGESVGIDDFTDNEQSVILYPNPTEGLFKIKTNNYDLKIITIYNLSGKLVYNQEVLEEEINIDLSTQASGQYIVMIRDKQNRLLNTSKLIKK